jgi:hypothetical protein
LKAAICSEDGRLKFSQIVKIGGSKITSVSPVTKQPIKLF